MRRQQLVVLAIVAMFGAACSDGAGTSGTTPDSRAALAPAALVPEVCWGPQGAYFGFDNQSSVPVVVPDGAGNRLEGGLADDNPLRTTLFAPGRTALAFWVAPATDDAAEPPPIIWTVTGPDDVERSATADDSTAQCADDTGEPNAADPRLADLKVSDEAVSAAGDSVSLTVTVTGVPDLSLCNAAFTAEPVGISLDAATLPTRSDPSRSFTLPLAPATSRPGRLASTQVVTNVVDRCTYDGLTVASWPITQPFATLGQGVSVCAWVDDSGALSVELTPGLCEMGVTGGSRNRPS
ncbi:MAG TPA: hypothetical protein PK020_09970 [Ilumatobacteraceae bacterium]|nr:hypothetical protein [Ilumatobacteraceae bacterium]HRB02376.1 hypothetical protein [Ilumatobacteraceae bacterium]